LSRNPSGAARNWLPACSPGLTLQARQRFQEHAIMQQQPSPSARVMTKSLWLRARGRQSSGGVCARVRLRHPRPCTGTVPGSRSQRVSNFCMCKYVQCPMAASPSTQGPDNMREASISTNQHAPFARAMCGCRCLRQPVQCARPPPQQRAGRPRCAQSARSHAGERRQGLRPAGWATHSRPCQHRAVPSRQTGAPASPWSVPSPFAATHAALTQH
jgi:hypothetical protein